MEIKFVDFKALCGLGPEDTFGSEPEDDAQFELSQKQICHLMVRACLAVSLSCVHLRLWRGRDPQGT